MATNTVYISVYDVSTYTGSGYNRIGIFTALTPTATFTEVTTSATRITLVSTTEYYTYTHTSADANALYKFKFFRTSGASSVFITAPFYADTTDVTEDLRYALEDIDATSKRYTIKELRRFVRFAIRRLHGTLYRKKFIVDVDGIISPRTYDYDREIILLQAMIEVNKSQLNRAADTAITFSDGRGRFSSQTHNALIDSIKTLTKERDMLIADTNRSLITAVRCIMPSSGLMA